VKYNVLIKKCNDPVKAARIIAEIARLSESTQKAVADEWAIRPICVREGAEEDDAKRAKAVFDAVGADVEIVPVSKSQGAGLASFGFEMIEEEEDGALGHLLNEKEFAEVLKNRKDIFVIDKDKRLRNLELISLVIALAFGLWLNTVEAVKVTADYANEKKVEQRTAKLAKDVPTEKKKEEDKKKEEEKKREQDKKNSEKKSLEKTKMAHRSGGNGDPRARLANQGVLGMITGAVKAKDVAGGDLSGVGGFAANVDAVLSGVGGLKAGGSAGSGRLAASGMGFGAGYGGGGGGGGGGGIDDLIGSLMSAGGGAGRRGGAGGSLELKRRKEPLAIQTPEMLDQQASLVGGRTKASIFRVVMQNMPALKYAYNKVLRDKPGLKGKITIHFAIDEFGKVIYCKVVESTIGDPELETSITDKIKRWVFDKIDKPGDISEVTYPFVFSQ
jgi:Na+-translocating ferredoxin:NAD+ oxidoreductase RnfG subunit